MFEQVLSSQLFDRGYIVSFVFTMTSSERRIPPAIADIEAIESLVVEIVEIAAGVVEELGKFGDTNERVVLDKCKILMNNAKVPTKCL